MPSARRCARSCSSGLIGLIRELLRQVGSDLGLVGSFLRPVRGDHGLKFPGGGAGLFRLAQIPLVVGLGSCLRVRLVIQAGGGILGFG